MTKFNLKEHIAKNKATFFSSLTEGQFSWMTQDTGQQIGSQDENKIPVYMFDDKGKYWFERDYEGYGVFGGKDYYDLVAEMNGYTADDAEKFGGTFGELRGVGIKLAFGELEPKNGGPVLFPALVVSPSNFNYKTHDFTKEAEHDPNQSWYEPEEDQDDDFGSDNDDEDYGYNDDEDELNEGKVEEAYNTYTFKVAKNFAKYMSKKEGRDFEVTMNSVDEYSFDLDLDGEPYAGGSYLIQNGNIHNVAIPGNPIYATTDDMEDYIGEGYDEFKRADKGSKNVTAKNKGEEEVYGAGVKKGEEIEKKKMKKSELTAKIREMVLAEANAPINMVTTMDGKTVVGTHQYGVGFKSNEAGQKMGFKDNPTSIPNGTKMSKNESLDEMEIDVQDSAKENSLYDPLAESDFLAELEGMLDEEDFSVTLLVPTVYFNPETGELAETPAAFGADSELEDMGITNYSDGDELSEWVFDNDIEKAKYFEKEYPGLFKVEGMMNEASEFDTNKPARIKEFIIALNRLVDEYHSELYLNDDLFAAISMVIKAAQEEAMNLSEAEGDKHVVMKGNKFYTGTEFVDDIKDAMKYNLKSATEIAKEKKGMVYTPKAVKEAKKDEEIEDEVDIDIESPEPMDTPTGGINVTQNADADLTGTEKELQDNLEAALEAAKKIGDEKLQQQIGNSLTFFTRQHVVKENLKETLLFQKRAGIITETQYKQKLNEISEDEDEVPLTSKVKSFINKAIADSKKDGSFKGLIEADWFENELIDELINLFPDKDYDSASPKVMNYISQAIK